MSAVALVAALVLGQGWFDTVPRAPPAAVRVVKTEKLRTPGNMPDVYVVHDDLRGVTCYITHSSDGGGGIFCMLTPAIAVEKGK